MSNTVHSSTNPAERTNLQRLFVLRNIAILGQMAAVYITHVQLDMRIPVVSLSMVIGLLAVFNLFTRMRLKWGGNISPAEFLLQLSVDVLVLTALLYQTGGASNPFVLLYLMPIIIGTVVLPGRFIWVLTMMTAAAYSFIMWQYIPLPHAHGSHDGFSLHVLGMWLAFVISAAITAYFVVGMRHTLRDREQALAAAREKQIRDDQLVALGTLAASTAHELGTPLGTMSLISEELEHNLKEADARKQLLTLREQIERCRQALSTLSASAGSVKLSGGEVLPVSSYLQSVLDEWQQARPDIKLTTDWKGIDSSACVLSDRTLNQALINILDNAADATNDNVEWISQWNEHELVMDIKDRGTGLSEEASKKIGKQPYTAKSEGLGLGLFLSHSIISRFGGEVKLYNRKGGGVTTHITLPLTSANMAPGT